MEPPPPRPKAVTFLALALGVLGAAGMAPAFLLFAPTTEEFPGVPGAVLALALVASNVALLVGAIGMWWMRDFGRATALAGVVLRAFHGGIFAFAPGHEAQRWPNLLSVAVFLWIAGYLVAARRRHAWI